MDNPGFILLIGALENEEQINQQRLNRRQLRDTSNPFSLPEDTFKKIYRLSRELANNLIHDLAPYMRDNQRDTVSIPQHLRVLAALNFFAHGSYQTAVGQDYLVAMGQSSVSKCIYEFNTAIEHFYHLIKFPTTNEECAAEKQGFMNMPNGFPGIIGAIDCTHIGIIAPPVEHPEFPAIVFLNRKGYYSLNVQIICNSTLKILAINARFPGSVHDSAIWSTSRIRQKLIEMHEEGNANSWLIGESGYPLEPWLMTPVSAAHLTDSENRYNFAHKSVRNVIKRLNGVLKGRFRCLGKHRILHYSPPVAARIVNACAVLHNLCVERGELDVYEDNGCPLDVNNEQNIVNVLNQGRITRQRIIRLYFE